ncbi:hypothetical protein F4802DRAFT_557602 [Xylaria palmicola]|nr:hypothetical protein F4802DRAFT_557602 [Xylaria palmicola]
MCLIIATHKMLCDIRPIMPHPTEPDTFIVDPYAAPQKECCVASSTTEDSTAGKKNCPLHPCCDLTLQTFSCGCRRKVLYHRYEPTESPREYTEKTSNTPLQGVWRKLESPDDIIPASEDSQQSQQPPPSDQLRVARRGRMFHGQYLISKAERLEAAAAKRQQARWNMENGGPLRQFQLTNSALERIMDEALELDAIFEAWKRTQETLEIHEYGKVLASSMSA